MRIAKPRPDTPFDGVDLLPDLTDKAELEADRPLFFRRRKVSTRQNQNAIRQSAVRQGDWKYLRTYKHLGDGKFSDRYAASLYNLKEDIAEEKDLSATAPEKMQTLSDLLEQWELEMSRTAAPFPSSKRQP